MHWHSWNQFSGEGTVTDANMREISAALISTGMANVGYDTVNVVCNGWETRDPVTHQFTENKAKWPTGMKGLGTYLHSKELKMGCYTAPGKTNCCGEPGSGGYEDVDMEFFAQIGCDHIMVDWCQTYVNPLESYNAYKKIGAAIANSSNPNMIYGIWETGYGKSWKWFADTGGHYSRVVTDMSNRWEERGPDSQPGSVLKNFDVAMSIPNIQSRTGRYNQVQQ
jgi:alpha-galactosidase